MIKGECDKSLRIERASRVWFILSNNYPTAPPLRARGESWGCRCFRCSNPRCDACRVGRVYNTFTASVCELYTKTYARRTTRRS